MRLLATAALVLAAGSAQAVPISIGEASFDVLVDPLPEGVRVEVLPPEASTPAAAVEGPIAALVDAAPRGEAGAGVSVVIDAGGPGSALLPAQTARRGFVFTNDGEAAATVGFTVDYALRGADLAFGAPFGFPGFMTNEVTVEADLRAVEALPGGGFALSPIAEGGLFADTLIGPSDTPDEAETGTRSFAFSLDPGASLGLEVAASVVSEAIVAPIPLPAGAPGLLTGLAALGWARRRAA